MVVVFEKMAPTHLRPRLYLGVIGLFIASLVSIAAHAQETNFEDLESRIDYAYFTEDVNTLRNLIQSTRATLEKGADAASYRYLLGFAHYRLGLLLRAMPKADAASAMSGCVDALGEVIEADPKSAEPYALQSACYGELVELRPWQVMIAAPLSALRMEKALKLAAANPRAVLLDGVRDYQRPKVLGGDKTRALAKFRRAIELFETQREVATGVPSWGLADAYADLGRGLMESGDTLGARNAFERALIIAPEFAAVRRDLKRLLGG
jgi:tetratricopeptide (TPR) repeat protein